MKAAPAIGGARRPAVSIGAGVILLALAGCAGARISDVRTENAAAAPPPAQILVEVDTQASGAAELVPKLQSTLVERLTKAKLSAIPFAPGASQPGAAVLHVSITETDPGNYLERFIVGFGLGRARMQAKVDLERPDAAGHPMTAFDTSAASGRFMPGLVLPAAISVATKNVIPIVVGSGLKAATSLRGGLDRTVDSTAKGVVDQLKKYYAAAGWHWPADDKA
jgi:hypothetical protein